MPFSTLLAELGQTFFQWDTIRGLHQGPEKGIGGALRFGRRDMEVKAQVLGGTAQTQYLWVLG